MTTKRSIDWRILLGFLLTVLWVATGLRYLLGVVGWQNFVLLPTADIGSFLEGAFAPLAFLWLVIGHFMQQTEIKANTRAIYLQEKRAQRLEIHSQRDSYFKLLNLVQRQLGAICALHYFSVCGPTGSREMNIDEFSEQRTQITTGDHTWFIRKMVDLVSQNADSQEKLHAIFYGNEERESHTNAYESTFGRLLEQAKAADTDALITDALLKGSLEGHYYRIIRAINGKEPDAALLGQLVARKTITSAASSARATS